MVLWWSCEMWEVLDSLLIFRLKLMDGMLLKLLRNVVYSWCILSLFQRWCVEWYFVCCYKFLLLWVELPGSNLLVMSKYFESPLPLSVRYCCTVPHPNSFRQQLRRTHWRLQGSLVYLCTAPPYATLHYPLLNDNKMKDLITIVSIEHYNRWDEVIIHQQWSVALLLVCHGSRT